MAEEKKSSVLKWILIGCGGLVLVGLLVIVLLGYLFKKKVVDPVKKSVNEATTEGKSFAAKMQVVSVAMMKPSVVSLLPVEEHSVVNKAFNDLSAKAAMMTDADNRELQQAMQEFGQDSAAAGADLNTRAAAAKKFAAAIQAVADKH